MNVQAYFDYDSKKSGGLTCSHLRFGNSPITSTYLISKADFVACHKASYMHQYDIVSDVKPGGVLMFSTCTVNEKENQENVGWFLEEFPEFQLEDLKEQMPEEIKPLVKNGQLQLLPGECNADGFFIAKLRRKG